MKEVIPDAPAQTIQNWTSGPVLALAISRPFATSAWAALMGPSDPSKATIDAPLSLRALYGANVHTNACFGSASEADAKAHAALFFPSLFESQSTCALLTPDGTQYLDDILSACSSVGLSVTSRSDIKLSKDRAAEFLKLMGANCPPTAASLAAPSSGANGSRPSTATTPVSEIGTFEAAVDHLTSGTCIALNLSGKGAIEQFAALLGPFDPLIAKVRCPSCLRARFGVDLTRAVGYGSLTPAQAAVDLKFFFPRAALPPLVRASHRHLLHTHCKQRMMTRCMHFLSLTRYSLSLCSSLCCVSADGRAE